MIIQRDLLKPQSGPFAGLEGVNETTRRILHTAWRAGLNPTEIQPEGGSRVFELNGLGKEEVFGVIRVGKKSGSTNRAVLYYGNSKASEPQVITNTLELQRTLTEIAVRHAQTGPAKVIEVFRERGPWELERCGAGTPTVDQDDNLARFARVFGLERTQVGLPEPAKMAIAQPSGPSF